MEIKEIIAQRQAKLDTLKAKGYEGYPAKTPLRIPIGLALADFQEGKKTAFAGRIIAKRSHGKAVFLDIRDATGKIQLYLKADILGEEGFFVYQNLDVADIVYAKGELFKTHTQEPTLKVEQILLLSKALRSLPEKWHGLKDTDLRYRQRYLDYISNEEVRKVFFLRSEIIRKIRAFLEKKGFLEVETPMMHYIPGGAAGRPFKTHHNEYDLDLYLRIAPELYLKQLLVAGMDKIYEINRSFRNEGVSTRHNPEFTMLELYEAYSDYEAMMHLSESLIVFLVQELFGSATIEYQKEVINFAPPWKKISFAQLVKEKFGILPSDSEDVMLKKLQSCGFAKETNRLSRTQIAKIIEEVLEEQIGQDPVFVVDYFTSLCPLAKAKREEPLIAERFELYIAGLEIGNAYSELNDPLEQRRRMEEEIKDLPPEERKALDEEFLIALEHGMPPAGGLGIGIDRLVMLLTNQSNIREVILFPLLRP